MQNRKPIQSWAKCNRQRPRKARTHRGCKDHGAASQTRATRPQSCATEVAARFAHRGVALLLVLVAVAVATTVSYAFVASQSTTISITKNIENQSKARYIAESGLKLAVAYVKSVTTWRSDQSDGTWVASQAFAGGTYSIIGEDGADTDGDDVITSPGEGDDDLADDQNDLLTLTVTGRYNGASHTVRAVLTPQVGNTIQVLLVTPNASTLSTQDAAKKILMESWGFTVTAISSTATQTEYNTAVTSVDVAYITEDVNSGNVNTKLKSATIGVVAEENALNDDMGISSSAQWYFGYSQINITDNSHYITENFSTGALTLTTANSELTSRQGTLAGGLNVLATRTANGDTTLDYIETGGALYGGGTAAGRRVFLPWGGASFDVALLNDDGKAIMRRSIEWATSGGGTGAGGYNVQWQN